MNRKLFRTTFKWFGILIIIHLVAMLLFGMFFSSVCQKLQYNEMMAAAHRRAMLGGVLIWALIIAVYFKLFTSFGDYRRELRNAMKEDSFSLFSYYKRAYLAEDAWRVAVIAFIQLPLVVFNAIVPIYYLENTALERFYSLELGIYGVLGIPVLGLLLATVLQGAIFVIIRFIAMALTVRGIRKE